MPEMIASTARATARLVDFVATSAGGLLSRATGNGLASDAGFMTRQANRIARCLCLSTQAEGNAGDAQLIVANHMGYLDVVALGMLGPMAFVSKSEVRRWPGIGRLATRGGTIFVDRERRGSLLDAAGAIRARVDAGVPVVVFPEGTSSDGSSVLPFHPSLFEIAVREHWRVAPAAIAYELPEGGDPATDVAYWGGMTFVPHFLRVLALPRIVARIRFGAPRQASGDRKLFARQMHSAVAGLHETLVHGEFRGVVAPSLAPWPTT